ncbi:MAG: hypothetical protein HOW73_29270 [Polyangiaceae bacterium]|nr:hypothetical protein [Polyangiaceae bacterium]
MKRRASCRRPLSNFAIAIRSRYPIAASVASLTLLTGACSETTDESAGEPAEEPVADTKQAVAGNIHPDKIEIDGPSAGADVFDNQGTPLNGQGKDWVKDSLANAGTNCLGSDGIATCVQAGVTGATGATGHWNGLRIVDGIGQNDQDIFVQGGKENSTATWTIQPSTTGGSKFELTQAYLANNQSNLFFGMERAGNNGTTAFDFEFNQNPPISDQCPDNDNPLIPCRTNGDILFTFEMRGSGGSGSAAPFVYTWNGTTYVQSTPTPAGVMSSINQVAADAAPWGRVDSHDAWVLADFEKFMLAEATAPITLLPGVNSCGGTAYVQVRTRASATPNSDLKDTSKVFEFQFNSLSGSAELTPSCAQGLDFEASALDANNDPVDGATCTWTFSDGTTQSGCSGYHAVAANKLGTITGSVVIEDPNNPACDVELEAGSVMVYAPLTVTADLDATCSSSFTYDATPQGGSGSVTYVWEFSGPGTTTPEDSTTKSGSVSVGTADALYTGSVTVTDARTDKECTASDSDDATPFAPLAVNLTKGAGGGSCPGISTDVITYTAHPSGGSGTYTLTWSDTSCSGSTCTIDPEGAFCHSDSLQVTVADDSGLCDEEDSETETYAKTTTVSASDNPAP